MEKRFAFVLTGSENSDRAIFSKKVLETIGFIVKFIIYIPNENKVLSNKISMQHIYEIIINKALNNEFMYVFEDDINVIENINIDEIIQYENISEYFFYLGMCESKNTVITTSNTINNHIVYQKSGFVSGLHAIGLSREGAVKLLEFSKNSDIEYMDVILEKFSLLYPANIVRYDLCSYISGHKGIIFQDRSKFPSSISN